MNATAARLGEESNRAVGGAVVRIARQLGLPCPACIVATSPPSAEQISRIEATFGGTVTFAVVEDVQAWASTAALRLHKTWIAAVDARKALMADRLRGLGNPGQ